MLRICPSLVCMCMCVRANAETSRSEWCVFESAVCCQYVAVGIYML